MPTTYTMHSVPGADLSDWDDYEINLDQRVLSPEICMASRLQKEMEQRATAAADDEEAGRLRRLFFTAQTARAMIQSVIRKTSVT